MANSSGENQPISAPVRECVAALESFFSKNWVLPASVLLAALSRFILVLTLGRHDRFYDEEEYWAIANSIAGGHGYRLFHHLTAYRPPAMPYFLAAGILLFGSHYWIFALANAALLSFLPFLVYWIGRCLGLPLPYATLAAVLAAFHPGLNFAATTLYPTTLTVIALTLSALLTMRALDRDSAAYGALAGLSAGVAAAATTVFVPFGVILACAATLRRHVRVAAWIAVLSLLPTCAWITRNHLLLHTYSIATNGGFNMELGANDQAEPRSGNLIRPDIEPEESRGGEVDWDRDHHARAKAWILSHPGRFAKLFVLRSAAVLDSTGKPATPGLYHSLPAQLIGWAMLPLILLSLLGLWLYRLSPLAWVTAGALLLIMFSSGLSIVKPRFRFPCDPLLMVFSVAALQARASQLLRKEPLPAAGLLAVSTGTESAERDVALTTRFAWGMTGVGRSGSEGDC